MKTHYFSLFIFNFVQYRLYEFRRTPTGNLTVQAFQNIWLEEGCDPPSFQPSSTNSSAEDRTTSNGIQPSTTTSQDRESRLTTSHVMEPNNHATSIFHFFSIMPGWFSFG